MNEDHGPVVMVAMIGLFCALILGFAGGWVARSMVKPAWVYRPGLVCDVGQCSQRR